MFSSSAGLSVSASKTMVTGAESFTAKELGSAVPAYVLTGENSGLGWEERRRRTTEEARATPKTESMRTQTAPASERENNSIPSESCHLPLSDHRSGGRGTEHNETTDESLQRFAA